MFYPYQKLSLSSCLLQSQGFLFTVIPQPGTAVPAWCLIHPSSMCPTCLPSICPSQTKAGNSSAFLPLVPPRNLGVICSSLLTIPLILSCLSPYPLLHYQQMLLTLPFKWVQNLIHCHHLYPNCSPCFYPYPCSPFPSQQPKWLL